MSDETNGNGNRLDRIEELLQEFVAQSMRNEFNLAAYCKANDERVARHDAEMAEIRASQAKTQESLSYLAQLVNIFGDKTYEFDEKIKRIKEAL